MRNGLIASGLVALAAAISVPAVQLASGPATAQTGRPVETGPASMQRSGLEQPSATQMPQTEGQLGSGGQSAVQGTGAKTNRGFFRSSCDYSHTANDDPILMPGMSGMSMEHDFFANTTTDASSTAQSLLQAGTTSCLSSEDTAAYWVPVLYQNGTPVTPKRLLAYYQVGRDTNPSQIQAMPFGLEMIAGNENGSSPPPLDVVSWSCGVDEQTQEPVIAPTDVPPVNCPAGYTVHLAIHFPNCFDGADLNGASQTNVTYSEPKVGCPDGYPVEIPQLTVHVDYPISSGTGITLSSAPGVTASVNTAHADFINAWHEAFLTQMVDECIHGDLRCGTIGPNNTPLFNVPERVNVPERAQAHEQGHGSMVPGAGARAATGDREANRGLAIQRDVSTT
ncbi:MAG: DUF1996 domain-containing protein [Acidimicrobiales bacterium]